MSINVPLRKTQNYKKFYSPSRPNHPISPRSAAKLSSSKEVKRETDFHSTQEVLEYGYEVVRSEI